MSRVDSAKSFKVNWNLIAHYIKEYSIGFDVLTDYANEDITQVFSNVLECSNNLGELHYS